MFEPETQHTQSAVSAQAEDVVGSHSDEDEAVDEAENGADDDDDLVVEEEIEEEIEDADPQLEIRYRACFGDMEKSAVPQAFDSSNKPLSQLYGLSLWRWVDEVVAELLPRKVTVVSLCAVIYNEKNL